MRCGRDILCCCSSFVILFVFATEMIFSSLRRIGLESTTLHHQPAAVLDGSTLKLVAKFGLLNPATTPGPPRDFPFRLLHFRRIFE